MGLLIFTHRKKLEHDCPHLSSEMRCNKSPQLKIYTILIALMSFVWQRVKAWSERQKNVLSSNYSPWKESIRIGFFTFFWIFFFKVFTHRLEFQQCFDKSLCLPGQIIFPRGC